MGICATLNELSIENANVAILLGSDIVNISHRGVNLHLYVSQKIIHKAIYSRCENAKENLIERFNGIERLLSVLNVFFSSFLVLFLI